MRTAILRNARRSVSNVAVRQRERLGAAGQVGDDEADIGPPRGGLEGSPELVEKVERGAIAEPHASLLRRDGRAASSPSATSARAAGVGESTIRARAKERDGSATTGSSRGAVVGRAFPSAPVVLSNCGISAVESSFDLTKDAPKKVRTSQPVRIARARDSGAMKPRPEPPLTVATSAAIFVTQFVT